MTAADDLLYRSLDQALDAIVVTEPLLEPPGPRILYVNRAFCELTGYSASEVLGQTPRILQGPETERRVLDRLREDLAAGRPFVGETVNYRKDGTPFWLRWHISPVCGPTDEPIAFVAVQRDVTAEHEAVLRQVEQISRLRAHAEYSERVVHDLDSALTAVALNAMLALDALRSTHPSDEFSRRMSHAFVERVGQAVIEARDIARELSLEAAPGPAHADVNRVAAQVVRELAQLAPERVSVVLEADPAGPAAAFPAQALRRILRNLIGNALDALGGDAGRIAVRTRAARDEVQIDVHDTGPGIPAAHLARIWTHGFSTKGPGRGRGLAAVVALLARHGGSIDLKTDADQGTAFRLCLSRADPRPA